VLLGNAGQLRAELLGIDAIGAHYGADQRVVQHLIERQFIVAKAHLFFSVFLFAFRQAACAAVRCSQVACSFAVAAVTAFSAVSGP
jgi:hypothetical protein